jgi:hypothetical protein
MSRRLAEYIRAKRRGGFGWIPKYEKQVGDPGAPYMSGHYMGMLDELIEAVGTYRAERIAVTLAEIDEGGDDE